MKNKLLNLLHNTRLTYFVVLGVILGTALPIVLFGLITIEINQKNKIDTLFIYAKNTMKTTIIASRGHLWDLRQDLAQELIDSIAADARIQEIEIIEKLSNKIFVQSKPKPNTTGKTYIFTESIAHEGNIIGEVKLTISDATTQQEIQAMQNNLFVIFLIQLLVVVVLLLGLLYLKVFKPLQKLKLQAQYFYDNKLEFPFEWKQKDEIGLVGQSFENARCELYELHQLSKQYEQNLECEVAQKTKELRELNENLETKVAQEIEKNKKQHILLQQQSRLAALGEMIGNIAHQWRQPLSAISTHASGLHLKNEYGMLDESDIIFATEGIMKSTQFLSQTIDDFRNFTKPNRQKHHFEIATTIMDVYNILKGTLAIQNIKIHFDLDKTIEYDGYANELSQVILNIFNNAKDAIVHNNIQNKHILVKLFSQDNKIIIKICDSAGGVPEHIINKIFDPYFTTKHQHQGTGIGLYMSMQIIQDNFQGKFYVQNEPLLLENESFFGACFYIELPL